MKTWASVLCVVAGLSVASIARAEPFFGATIGAADIRFKECHGDCSALKSHSTEGVFGVRAGNWWKYLGLSAEFQQTAVMHAEQHGQVDNRYVSASLLARLPMNGWFPYAGVTIGAQFTATPIGDCNHHASGFVLGVSQAQHKHRWSYFAEVTHTRGHHMFEESMDSSFTTRQHTTVAVVGATYAF